MANPPNKQYKWALDSTFDPSVGPSGSAWHNEPNKVLPSDLRVSQGYVPSQSLDAESLNYLLNSHGDWVGYLSESFHTASVDISVVEDVLNDTNISGSSGQWDYLGGARSRTRIFHPFQLDTHTAQIISGNFSWYGQLGRTLTSITNFARATFNLGLFIPSGSTVTRYRVLVQPGAARASGSRMLLSYTEQTPNFATPAVPSTFSYDLDFDNGTTNNQNLDSGVISIDVDQSTKMQFFTVIAGDTAATQRDDVFAIEITYDEPGPRGWT